MTEQVNQVSECCPRCGAYKLGGAYSCGTPLDLGWLSRTCRDRQITHLTSLLAERDAEVESAKACLAAYEQWEADVILSDEAWGGGMAPLPTITQELWDRLFEIQVMRNKVLHTTPTPKGEA